MKAGDRPVAWVTGSAKRLGRALVERLAAEGYATWVHCLHSAAEAEAVADGIRARGGVARVVRGDMASADDIAAMVARVEETDGRLDVLVNNVGVYHTGPLADFARDDFDAMWRANLLGPFDLIRRVAPLFGAAGGSIVNIGYTGLEHNGAGGKAAAYACTKAGLLILTRSFAEELGPRGIRVNMVSPGHIDNSVDLPDGFDGAVPLGRAGTVEDICEAVCWLTSARAGYVTGQNVEVAGGYMMGLRPDR